MLALPTKFQERKSVVAMLNKISLTINLYSLLKQTVNISKPILNRSQFTGKKPMFNFNIFQQKFLHVCRSVPFSFKQVCLRLIDIVWVRFAQHKSSRYKLPVLVRYFILIFPMQNRNFINMNLGVLETQPVNSKKPHVGTTLDIENIYDKTAKKKKACIYAISNGYSWF